MCISPNMVFSPMGRRVKAPCRRCWSCRRTRRNQYVARALCEAAYSDWSCFITLTYAPRDDGADVFLNPEHAQDFIRSLRDTGHKVRYLIAGEYGERKGRAHFHALLFGRGRPPQIAHKKRDHVQWWKHGHVYCKWGLDYKKCGYVCKYVVKNEEIDAWISTSKKPILGYAWAINHAASYAANDMLPRGLEFMPPGGKKGEPYAMMGTFERVFLLELYRLAPHLLHRDKTPWVQNATNRVWRWLAEKRASLRDPRFLWLEFRREVAERHMSMEKAERLRNRLKLLFDPGHSQLVDEEWRAGRSDEEIAQYFAEMLNGPKPQKIWKEWTPKFGGNSPFPTRTPREDGQPYNPFPTGPKRAGRRRTLAVEGGRGALDGVGLGGYARDEKGEVKADPWAEPWSEGDLQEETRGDAGKRKIAGVCSVV